MRSVLVPKVYTLPLVQIMQVTMTQGRNYGPQVLISFLFGLSKDCTAADAVELLILLRKNTVLIARSGLNA